MRRHHRSVRQARQGAWPRACARSLAQRRGPSRPRPRTVTAGLVRQQPLVRALLSILREGAHGPARGSLQVGRLCKPGCRNYAQRLAFQRIRRPPRGELGVGGAAARAASKGHAHTRFCTFMRAHACARHGILGWRARSGAPCALWGTCLSAAKYPIELLSHPPRTARTTARSCWDREAPALPGDPLSLERPIDHGRGPRGLCARAEPAGEQLTCSWRRVSPALRCPQARPTGLLVGPAWELVPLTHHAARSLPRAAATGSLLGLRQSVAPEPRSSWRVPAGRAWALRRQCLFCPARCSWQCPARAAPCPPLWTRRCSSLAATRSRLRPAPALLTSLTRA